MTFRVVMLDRQVGRWYSTRMTQRGREYRRAAAQVSLQIMNEMVREGREDIRRSGNFGARWTQALHGRVDQRGGDILISIMHDIPYWTTHQFGAHIEGRPLLWIPAPWADDAKGVSARDYPEPLFRVDRDEGAPLLMDFSGEVKYTGHESVDVPKRWHLIEEIREVAKKFPAAFRAAVRRI